MRNETGTLLISCKAQRKNPPQNTHEEVFIEQSYFFQNLRYFITNKFTNLLTYLSFDGWTADDQLESASAICLRMRDEAVNQLITCFYCYDRDKSFRKCSMFVVWNWERGVQNIISILYKNTKLDKKF